MVSLISLLMQPASDIRKVTAGEPSCPTETTADGPLVVCRESHSDRYRIPPSERKKVKRSISTELSPDQRAVLAVALKAYDPNRHFCVLPWLSGEPISYRNREYATPKANFSALALADAQSWPSALTPRSIRNRISNGGKCLSLSVPRIVKHVADLLIDNAAMTPSWHIIRLRRVGGSWTVAERQAPGLG